MLEKTSTVTQVVLQTDRFKAEEEGRQFSDECS